MRKPLPIDVSLIRKTFIYHQGILYWAVDRSAHTKVGDVAGSLRKIDGYWQVSLNGRNYRRARLVYSLHYGYPGELEIDHINRDRSDDRIGNLRAVTHSQNSKNKGLPRTNTGHSGISETPSCKYRSSVNVNGKHRSKTFKTIEEAISWRKEIKNTSRSI